MDDPAKTGPVLPVHPSSRSESSARDEEDFARIRRRTRHPALALAAGLLALFLIGKMRFDLAFFLSSPIADDLGDARALLGAERGRQVLARERNRVVRVSGTPDRESALQIDTKGSWTFTQFFRLLGTDGRLFVHRREDPLPAARAEHDVFEGRLIRFSDLSFEDAIRAYFAGHVSATHFFAVADLRARIAAGVGDTLTLQDLTGDGVVLGRNDILAIDVVQPDALEVGLATRRFPSGDAARQALVAAGANVLGPGRGSSDRQAWRIDVPSGRRDALLGAIAVLDPEMDIRAVRETVKVRLGDLTVAADTPPGSLVAKDTAGLGAVAPDTARVLAHIDTVRTLATVQIPDDAFLIVEAEKPREHLPEAAVAVVLVVFASVNLAGLMKGLRA
jgi:hypothetical protein